MGCFRYRAALPGRQSGAEARTYDIAFLVAWMLNEREGLVVRSQSPCLSFSALNGIGRPQPPTSHSLLTPNLAPQAPKRNI
ncbi:hypothetical protein KDK_36690 [Dictyobacter kobayashii]|uniref:Uncharacterized protein n=1 Tax=Dictyobacter kobayashii TaxID=2014872 RepID=A0A402ALE4_9CHLR|nr:hypothetical protein KDK_36690 [Dictyobacter kobayashii]